MLKKVFVLALLGTVVIAPDAFARRGIFGAIGKAVSSSRRSPRSSAVSSPTIRPRIRAGRSAAAAAVAGGAVAGTAYAAEGGAGSVSAPSTEVSPYGSEGIPPRSEMLRSQTVVLGSTRPANSDAQPLRLAAGPRRALASRATSSSATSSSAATPGAVITIDATNPDSATISIVPQGDASAEAANLPNSGGAPLLMSLSGLALAASGLLLRRKFAA